MLRVGVIGYGNRISSVIRLAERLEPECRIVAITDVRNDEIKKTIAERDDIRETPDEITFYTEPERMLEKETLDGVFIGTRCSLHATMACKVAPTGLPLYLEKPVATTLEDLKGLKAAFEGSSCEVVVSFPLRLSPLVQIAREVIESGRIGTVEQVQAVNNVPYGTGYFSNWYRDYNETGGLWLQKATHDFDYMSYLMGEPIVRVAAMGTYHHVFGGTKEAGLVCSKCSEQDSCLESPANRRRNRTGHHSGNAGSVAGRTRAGRVALRGLR